MPWIVSSFHRTSKVRRLPWSKLRQPVFPVFFPMSSPRKQTSARIYSGECLYLCLLKNGHKRFKSLYLNAPLKLEQRLWKRLNQALTTFTLHSKSYKIITRNSFALIPVGKGLIAPHHRTNAENFQNFQNFCAVDGSTFEPDRESV